MVPLVEADRIEARTLETTTGEASEASATWLLADGARSIPETPRGRMRVIKDRRWLYAKGALFLLLGLLSAGLLMQEARSWRVAVLLALAIWAFCRAYFFAFYVVEHFVDPTYRYDGLIDFAMYVLWQRGPQQAPPPRRPEDVPNASGEQESPVRASAPPS